MIKDAFQDHQIKIVMAGKNDKLIKTGTIHSFMGLTPIFSNNRKHFLKTAFQLLPLQALTKQ
jgi:hypothetical protein